MKLFRYATLLCVAAILNQTSFAPASEGCTVYDGEPQDNHPTHSRQSSLSPFENSQSYHEAKIPSLSDAERSSIRFKAEKEPSVANWIRSVDQLKAKTNSPLFQALKNPISDESQVYAEYLRYVSHRNAQEKIITPTSRELGFSDFDDIDVMDSFMLRFTDLGERIPANTCKKLSHLIQGGAYRVKMKADSYMLNRPDEHFDKLSGQERLHQIQDALFAQRIINITEMDKMMEDIIWMDGTSAFSIKSKEFTTVPSTTQAIEPYNAQGLITKDEQESLAHVTQQLPESKAALVRMSNAIDKLSPKDPAYLPKIQFYKSYVNHTIYNAEDILRAHGAFDRLAEAVVEVGDAQAANRLTEFLINGLPKAKVVFSAEKLRRIQKKQVWYTLLQTTRERDRWDAKSLNFVLDQLEAIADSDPEAQLEEQRGSQWLREVNSFRLSEPISVNAIRAFVSSTNKTAKVKVGAMVYDLEKDANDHTGKSVKVIRIRPMDGFSQIGATGQEANEAAAAFQRAFTEWNPKLDDFRKFLGDSNASRRWVKIGSFEVYFRKEFGTVGKRITLGDINSDSIGSGLYASLLKTIEKEAAANGVSELLIQTVANRRHQNFYETKMGYAKAKGYSDDAPSYFKRLL